VGHAAGPLPNFLIIGAMKAGTTSLYHYLREHPQIFMPALKAPEFFAGGPHWERGVDWYRKQFAGAGEQALGIGEASNVYTRYPQYRGVPERISAHIPAARLIYVVREPIERIRSHYQTRVAEGVEKASFEEAVFENPIYVAPSRYALQLDQYLEYFPREQLLIITAEDLRNARQATVRRVYEFLGVGREYVPPNLARDFYRTQDRAKRSPVPYGLRKFLKRRFPEFKRAKELENNVVGALKRLSRPSGGRSDTRSSVVINEATRARLAEMLADDVRRLRSFLGGEFDGWGIA
jgi:hypothetical protein